MEFILVREKIREDLIARIKEYNNFKDESNALEDFDYLVRSGIIDTLLELIIKDIKSWDDYAKISLKGDKMIGFNLAVKNISDSLERLKFNKE